MFVFRAGFDTPFDVSGLKLVDRIHPAYKCPENFGTLTTPAYNPLMGFNYEGFDVIPRADAAIALIKPGDGFYRWQSGSWQPTNTPAYYSVAEIRNQINKWTGAIQFQIKVLEGKIFREIALGCFIPLDILGYLLNFRLPEILSRPIAFYLPMKTSSTGTITLPDYSQIANLEVRAIGNNLPTPFTRNGNILSTGLNSQPVYLSFSTIPKVSILDINPHQITTLPEILVQPKSERNIRGGIREDWLETSNGDLVQSLIYAADQPIEIAVIAKTQIEARNICQQLIYRIQSAGYVFSPADDRKYPLQVVSGVSLKPTIGALSNSAIASFEVKIPQMSFANRSSLPRVPA